MDWYCYSDSKTTKQFEALSTFEAKWHALLLARNCTVQRITHPEMCAIGPCFYVEEWQAFVYICQGTDRANPDAAELAKQFPEHSIVLIDQEPGPSETAVTIYCSGAKEADGRPFMLEAHFLLGGATDVNGDGECFVFWTREGAAFEPMTRTFFRICLCKRVGCEKCERWMWFTMLDQWISRKGGCCMSELQTCLSGEQSRAPRLERLTEASEVWELEQINQCENLFLQAVQLM